MKELLNLIKMAVNFSGRTRIQTLLKAQGLIQKELRIAQQELKLTERKSKLAREQLDKVKRLK